MNDAPCNPKSLSDRFSIVKVVFLTKNTTSRLQHLDMGIIRNSNVKYRQKLLTFAISRIGNNVKTIGIIEGVDILKTISWIKSAWEEVLDQAVINGFHKFGIWQECPDVQVLDQEEE